MHFLYATRTVLYSSEEDVKTSGITLHGKLLTNHEEG